MSRRRARPETMSFVTQQGMAKLKAIAPKILR
jgi:hypothetical protein